MAEITASMVKELRDKTGAGMMDCKKALAESGGDLEKAVDELRKRGQAIANKVGAREAKEGLIFLKTDGRRGVMLELNCITDFVARNEDFKKLGNDLLNLVFSGAMGKVEELLEAPYPGAGKPVREVLTDQMAKTGENLVPSRFVVVEAGPDSVLTGYTHLTGKLGVLVELKAGKAATLEVPAVRTLAADLTMQVAAANPLAVRREELAADKIARERAIYADQVKLEGKPEKIAEKIVEGKMAKFYKDAVLLDQDFVKDGDLTIGKLLEKVGKEAGDTLTIGQVLRYEVGGGEAKTEEA